MGMYKSWIQFTKFFVRTAVFFFWIAIIWLLHKIWVAENSVFYTLCASCSISLSFWTSLVLHCHDWLFANLWITLCVLLKCSKYLNLPRNCPLVFRDKKIISIFVEATYDFNEKKFQDQFLWLISFHFPSAFYHLLITTSISRSGVISASDHDHL